MRSRSAAFVCAILLAAMLAAVAGAARAEALASDPAANHAAGTSLASADSAVWQPLAASKRFQWQTPAPQGNFIAAVDFVSDTTGWAVGTNGTVIKTTDGGASWIQQGPIAPQGESAVVYDMTDVCFVDASHGWATGGNMVWRTTNGGATWSSSDTPELYDPVTNLPVAWLSVDFSDAQNGWVVSHSIYHTTDGGQTWTAQANPTDAYPSRVVAASSTTAYVSGTFAGYLKTSDAGANWEQRLYSAPGTATAMTDSIAAVNDSKLYAVAGGGVLLTTNGGTSWSKTTVGNVDGDDVYEVCTVDDGGIGGTAWAFTASGAVFKTTDSGATPWIAGPALGESAISPDAPSSLSVFVTTGRVLGSTDGGASFTPRYAAAATGGMSAIDFVSATTGFAVGAYEVLSTENGGADWAPHSLASYGLFAIDIFFLESDPQTGWIVGSSGDDGTKVLKTSNGGTDWVAQPETAAVMREVCFPDADNGWATNNSWGGFWRSTNGGANWTKVVRDGFFWDVDFVDSSNGWIALDLGDGTNQVLHTTDGGDSWTTQTLPASGGGIYQLDFVDTTHGWCSDTFGNVYRTTNGGALWTALASSPGPTVDIKDMKFTSRSRGWIVGEQWSSAVLSSYRHDFAAYTADGGKTWDYQVNSSGADYGSTGSKVGIRAVDSVGGTACWIAGGASVLTGEPAAGPVTTQAPSAASVKKGKTATLKYRVNETIVGGVADVTITIKNKAKKVVKTIKIADAPMNKARSVKFKCTLKKGVYTFSVSAKTHAGGRSAKAASNKLTVK